MAGIRLIIASCGLAFVALTACSAPRFNYVGTWRGSYDVDVPEGQDPLVISTLSRVELIVKPNNDFELFEAGMPKTGRIRYSGDTAYLTIHEVLDRPVRDMGEAAEKMNREIELKPIDENSILYHDPTSLVIDKEGRKAPPVRLERQTQPAGEAPRKS